MKLAFKVVESTRINESLARLVFEGGCGSEKVRFTLHSREKIALGTAFDATIAAPEPEPEPVPAPEPPAPPKVKPAKKAEPTSAKESKKKKK